MSDSVQPHRRQPTRLRHPWDSPGKNTGVGCHFLLQCMTVKSESEVTQVLLTLSDPKDCSLPGPSIHRIFQARVLDSVAIAFSEQDGMSQELLVVSTSSSWGSACLGADAESERHTTVTWVLLVSLGQLSSVGAACTCRARSHGPLGQMPDSGGPEALRTAEAWSWGQGRELSKKVFPHKAVCSASAGPSLCSSWVLSRQAPTWEAVGADAFSSCLLSCPWKGLSLHTPTLAMSAPPSPPCPALP